MEDRYLFKAKRKDNCEWVFGGLSYCDKTGAYFITNMGKDHISYIGFHQEVDSNTICQCTGLKDKNGKLIWENDIVKGKYYDNGKSHRHIGQVKYIYEAYKVVGVKQYTGYHAHLDGSYEVIGNIFDNKELLESEDKNESNY